MNVSQKMTESINGVLRENMGLRDDEKLLVFSDSKQSDVAGPFVEGARRLGIETCYLEIDAQASGEPPLIVSEALKLYDAALLITSSSFSGSQARIAATKRGARIASMPTLTLDIAESCMDSDTAQLEEISVKYAKLLTAAKVVRISTDLGTSLTLYLDERLGMTDTGNLQARGAFGNLPAGEALIAPIEGLGDGVLVVDGVISMLGKISNPVTLNIKNGRIQEISGTPEGLSFEGILSGLDDNARNVAEFGIGTNKKASLQGNPLVDEKVFGTVHIGFGANLHMGGRQASGIHYDCIINRPTVYLDDECIIHEGIHMTKEIKK